MQAKLKKYLKKGERPDATPAACTEVQQNGRRLGPLQAYLRSLSRNQDSAITLVSCKLYCLSRVFQDQRLLRHPPEVRSLTSFHASLEYYYITVSWNVSTLVSMAMKASHVFLESVIIWPWELWAMASPRRRSMPRATRRSAKSAESPR